MGRKPRIEYPGAFYHVYARGNRKLAIFGDDEDKKRFLTKLGEYKKRQRFLLYAYSLMDNHFHLLLETRDTSLSRIMQVLLQTHARSFNRKYQLVGHLFQGRYRAILCDRDAYLLALIRYIHLNCVRAGIVIEPSQYQWSSHRTYLGIDDNHLADTEFVLSQFSENRAHAIELYRDFIMAPKDIENLPNFYQVVDQRILGEHNFVETVRRKIEADPQSNGGMPKNKSLKDVGQVVAQLMDTNMADLQSSKRGEQLNRARSLFVRLCNLYVPAKREEIARFLKREPGSLAHIERYISLDEFECLRKKIVW